MNILMRLLSIFVVMVLLVGLAVPAFAQKQASDDRIHDQVMEKLASDRDVKGGGIEIDVKEGVVTLRGKVREEKQKSKAERLARKVKGVQKVVNELQVDVSGGSGS